MGLKFRVFAEAPMDDVILGVDGQRFCRDGRQPAEVAARTRGKPVAGSENFSRLILHNGM